MIDQNCIEKINFIIKKFYEKFDERHIGLNSFSIRDNTFWITYCYRDRIDILRNFCIPMIVVDLKDDSVFELFWNNYKSKSSINDFKVFIKNNEKEIKSNEELLKMNELAFQQFKYKHFKEEIDSLKERIAILNEPIARWKNEIIQSEDNIKKWNDFIQNKAFEK